MSKPSPKQQLFVQLARAGKGIAHPSRLELIEAMAQGEKSVEALSRACGMAFSNVSHHLQILKDCGLAASRKEGLQVFYRLADAEVPAMIASLRRIAERQLAEVERIVRDNFESRDALQPVRREELLKMARRGEAMVIDVRPAEEYESGHIAGAVNVPLDSLPANEGSHPSPTVVALRIRAHGRGCAAEISGEPWAWRKRAGVEPTRDRLAIPAGFEDRPSHRGTFSSAFTMPSSANPRLRGAGRGCRARGECSRCGRRIRGCGSTPCARRRCGRAAPRRAPRLACR